MIVVEGYDCSGKSTLVGKLDAWTDNFYAIKHSGGPPTDLNHVRRCLARCLHRMSYHVIQDRVTQVSESVYGIIVRPAMSALALSRIGDLRHARLLIYCRPDRATILDTLGRHKAKAHDTPEHIEHVLAHATTMINIYDTIIEMARQHVDVFKYDYQNTTHDDQLREIIEGIDK